jgi:hypothetical protein
MVQVARTPTASRPLRAWALGALLLSAAAASAQPVAAPAPSTPPVAPAAAVPAVPAAPAASASASSGVPEVERRVIEDDGVRIEEVRVRGQVQSIHVQSKVGNVRAYEFVVGRGGRDPSQDKSATGQRVWSLLKF